MVVQRAILDRLRELQRELGFAVLFISHDIGSVLEMADRVMVMYAGRVVEHGTAAEVLLEPLHPYTEGLLASIPSRGMRGQRLNVITGTVPNPFNMPTGCNFTPRCPYRFEPCAIHDPLLGDARGRKVACWRWLEPPSVEPASVAEAGAQPDVTAPLAATQATETAKQPSPPADDQTDCHRSSHPDQQ